MKTSHRRLALNSFGLALCIAAFFGLVLTPDLLRAVPPSPIFPGTWSGGLQSDSGGSGTASLQISSVDGLRFEGIVNVVPPTPIVPPSPIKGAVSAAGEISLEADGDTAFVEAHGQVGINTLSLDYHIIYSDGTFDSGSMELVLGGGDESAGS